MPSQVERMRHAIQTHQTDPKPPKAKEPPGESAEAQAPSGTTPTKPDAPKKVEKAKKKAPRITHGTAPQRDKAQGRLPDGAHFDVKYDATAERWTGTLSFPREGREPKVFSNYSSGVFRLLANLDKDYRAWAARKAEEATTPEPEKT